MYQFCQVPVVTSPNDLEVQAINGFGQTLDDVPLVQHFGFHAMPLNGWQGLILDCDARPICLGVQAPTLPAGITLQAGEAILYNAIGIYIHLKANGTFDISGNITLTGNLTQTGNIALTGNLVATGNIADSVGTLDALRQAYLTHTHAVSGGTTGVPL